MTKKMSPRATSLKKINAKQGSGDRLIHCDGEVTIAAAQGGDTPKPAQVSILAYNGGALRVGGYDHPVYIDVDGVSGFGRQLPLLRDHDRSAIIGGITATRSGTTIQAEGRLVGRREERQEVEELAAEGYAWQASVGVRPTELRFVKAGNKTSVNGQTVQGPAYIAAKSRLAEISIVTIGADAETAVGLAVAASDPADADLEATGGMSSGSIQAFEQEQNRRRELESIALKVCKEGADITAVKEMLSAALSAGTGAQMFELELLRKAQRPQMRIAVSGGNQLVGHELEAAVEASLLRHMGELDAMAGQYDERTLTALDRHRELKHGLSLVDLLAFASEANGSGRHARRNVKELLEGAFIQASGLSTINVGGILSNIANKFLKASFEAVESSWRAISEIRSVNDFKTMTSYSLTGDMTYEKVAPGGELKSATIGEQSFTNRAETYGRLFSLDRRDIVNDDLGAFNQLARRLGRGAALRLNDVFWAEFLAGHGTFFTSGNKNLIGSGSSAPWYLLVNPADLAMIQVVFLYGRQQPTVEQTDADFKQLGIQMRGYHDFGVNKQEPRAAVKSPAALDIAGLTAADQLMLDQVDYDGKPLALRPSILLVSNVNKVKAMEIMQSTTVVGPTSAKTPSANVFAGAYTVISSSYLPNS